MTSAALAACVTAADLDVVMIAGRYTLLDQSAADEVLPACDASGTDVVIASVFNSGLLASRIPSREGRYEYGRVPDQLWDRLQAIHRICDAHDVALPAAALQFALRHPSVRSVVVGGSRPAQLRENAALMAETAPDALWADLLSAGLIPAEPAHPDHPANQATSQTRRPSTKQVMK
jgi:D-threo-aldose 1-dehydrogenase